jgi:hypothetical protein
MSAQTVGEWLASADPDRDHAHRWWEARGIALMPVGRRWDVVKTSDAVPLAVDGPAIHDPRGRVIYYLVPPGTAAGWEALPGTEALGDTAYLTIPGLDRTAPPGTYWLRAPQHAGHLVRPEALRDALTEVAA